MIVYNDKFEKAQLNIISAVAGHFGISEKTAGIMFSRGIDSIEKAERFLNPGKRNFADPYGLLGMKEAVERITLARDGEERVMIFGDYDADGICASAVLTKSLKKFGIKDIVTVVPEREQGYGLTHELVERLLEEYSPDLLITVDCGISCLDEVAYIEDLGVEVIVTDHHEPPPELPDCTVIDCKIKGQEYPCEYLCGAGVAYKLARALIGEKADMYLDLVSVATIADSMPLKGENRDIVKEGLKILETSPCLPLQKLIEISGLKDLSSESLAFTVTPRINAAGRMGDAKLALDLFLEDDEKVVWEYCRKLNDYNMRRQSECDDLLKSAEEKLAQKGVGENIIVLYDDGWNGGLIGIAAAKLAEKYYKPVILFTKSGEIYHGSARSIEDINIFEAISACTDLTSGFGGHAQAAGINVAGENLEAFTERISKFIGEKYSAEYFVPKISVEGNLDEKFTLKFADEIEMLGPFGTGNKRPLFCLKAENLNAVRLKPMSPHISFRTEYIDLIYFGGESYLDIINSPAEKDIVFEPVVTQFGGRRNLKGYVKDFEYSVINNRKLRLDCFKAWLLSALAENASYEIIDEKKTEELAEKYKEDRHTVFTVCDIDNLRRLKLGKMNCALYRPKGRSASSELVFSLSGKGPFDVKRVIYLDRPLKNTAKIDGALKYYVSDCEAYKKTELSTSHALFGEVFMLLKRNIFYGTDSTDVALAVSDSLYSDEQIIFCLEVFMELKIFAFKQGVLKIDERMRSELMNSAIYRAVCDRNGRA